MLMVLRKYVGEGWFVHHADIATAFLNGEIDGELFIEWDGVAY